MNKSKRNIKGFTLVELIVVMAVFGLIMLGALRLLDPVNRMMKSASIQESNTATVDNIKRYFEGTLRYANAVYVHNGDLKYYATGGMPTVIGGSEEDRQKEAVQALVDNVFINRVDESDTPITNGTAYVMKIDNDNQGRITESVFSFDAGYKYKQWNPATSNWDIEQTRPANVSLVSFDQPVINDVYYENYSIFVSLGYNTMQAVEAGIALPTPVEDKQYFGQIVPEKADALGNAIFSPSDFAFTFTTYKNQNGTKIYHHEIDGKHIFGSPYSSANASLALLNINSAYGGSYRSNLDYYPVRRDGNGYNPTDMVDDNADLKWDYEKMPDGAVTYARVYDSNNIAGGNNIYIVYTLPE
ncbi:MAG: prepilin-type N-terminal cleavage/methylation domain-containing protein [Ruminococcus sp.]|nr:prepilin-type N-terminal cleavage/methylation domain-containing protein [Ruminococcus sp.]